MIILLCIFSLYAVFLAFQVSEPNSLERTAYGAEFQSKYCLKGAAETKKYKLKRTLQKTHGGCTVEHGRVLKAVGMQGLAHGRASSRE